MASRVASVFALALCAACSVDTSDPIVEGESEAGTSETSGSETQGGGETGDCPDEPAAEVPELAWRVELDSELDDAIGDIAIDAQGRIHVVGWLRELDPFPNDLERPAAQAFVAVYSPAGEELERTSWEVGGSVEGVEVTRLQQLELGPGGERYVAGRSNAELEGLGGNGGDSAFVAELDPAGEIAWVQLFDAFPDSYEAPEAFGLSATGELLFIWGSAESEPIFGFPSHYFSRLSASGERELDVALELGDWAYVGDVASDCLGEHFYVTGTVYTPDEGGFLARLDRDLNPVGLSWWGSPDSSLSQLSVTNAGVHVIGSVSSGSTGLFARYDAEGQLQWSRTDLDNLTGLQARGGTHFSGRGMEVIELAEQEGWSVAVPERGGEFEFIQDIAKGPGGAIAVSGSFLDSLEAEQGDAFLALLLPPN